jgi:Kef-type K+ transport system membrane component KefB
MSAAVDVKRGPGGHALQAVLLVALGGLLWIATRAVPDFHGGTWTIAAVGFLLLAGTLLSDLVALIGMPHLTGYLLAGIIAGPHLLKLVDHDSVTRLSSVNALALALIALEGGAELRIAFLREGLRGLAWSTILQTFVVLFVMTGVFFLARPLLPFASGLTSTVLLGAALLWGVMSITRSPSATLGILSQTRANGPLARFTLTFVMTSDLVMVVVLATVLTVCRPLVEPGATFSAHAFQALGHEILGSVSLGSTLGLVLVIYLRFIGKQLVLVFLALGFGMTEMLNYLSFDPLLTFMVAGFLVQNLSKQGEKFLHALHQTGGIVYVVFFATAGAHLDVPLLRDLWPVALLLSGARALTTYGVGRLSSRLAGDHPMVRRWGWSGLVSQAGLALGLAVVVAHEFPAFGNGFRALAVATVALNEMIGPILFKFALDRSGETSHAPEPSIVPGAGEESILAAGEKE